MQTLGEVLEQITDKQDRYTVNIEDTWLQGRSCYGGLSAAVLTRAMREQVGEEIPMRSLLTNFIGPLGGGSFDVTVETLRIGKNVQHVTARAIKDGEVATMSTAVFGADRQEIEVPAAPVANVIPREKLPPIPEMPGGPKFHLRYDQHWKGNAIPMSGTNARDFNGWIRCKDGFDKQRIERMVSMADMPPPIMMSWFKTPMAGSSVTWSLEFVKQPSEIDGEWFWMDYSLDAAHNGYSLQSGQFFDEAGNLVMTSRQCMAYFGK